MFAKQLPASVFEMQREFIRIMNSKRDFYWWATTLVTEETKELKEAFAMEPHNMQDIFKELADVVYVVAGFYNTLPNYGSELLSKEQNQRVINALEAAEQICSEVCHFFKIPLPMVVEAFEAIHRSNMSKLDDNGHPIRREDGKIMKGPNYQAPDMTVIVDVWRRFRMNEATQGVKKNVSIH